MSVKDKVSGLLQGLIENLGEKLVLELVRNFFTPEKIKDVLDALFDKVEELVEKSETKADDKMVLPIIDALRKSLNVPDND